MPLPILRAPRAIVELGRLLLLWRIRLLLLIRILVLWRLPFLRRTLLVLGLMPLAVLCFGSLLFLRRRLVSRLFPQLLGGGACCLREGTSGRGVGHCGRRLAIGIAGHVRAGNRVVVVVDTVLDVLADSVVLDEVDVLHVVDVLVVLVVLDVLGDVLDVLGDILGCSWDTPGLVPVMGGAILHVGNNAPGAALVCDRLRKTHRLVVLTAAASLLLPVERRLLAVTRV